MPANPTTYSLDLVKPIAAIAHTGRIAAVAPPARIGIRDLDLGDARVRLIRTAGIRFDRSKDFAERVPRQRALMHLVSGALSGRFGETAFRMGPGDSILHDTSYSGGYESSDGTLMLVLFVRGSEPLEGGELPAVTALPNTPLLAGTVAFLRALCADRRDESIGSAEGQRIADIVTGLVLNIIAEHRAAIA